MEQWEYKIKEFTTWHRIGKTKDGGVGEIIGFEIFKQIEVEGFFGKKKKRRGRSCFNYRRNGNYF